MFSFMHFILSRNLKILLSELMIEVQIKDGHLLTTLHLLLPQFCLNCILDAVFILTDGIMAVACVQLLVNSCHLTNDV